MVADRGREFAWVVGDGWVRWGYTLAPVPGAPCSPSRGRSCPPGWRGSRERYGDGAAAEVEERTRAAHDGIPATLAAIRAVAEG